MPNRRQVCVHRRATIAKRCRIKTAASLNDCFPMTYQRRSKHTRDKNQTSADVQNPFHRAKGRLKIGYHKKIGRVGKPIERYPKRKNDRALPKLPTQQRQKTAASTDSDCVKF